MRVVREFDKLPPAGTFRRIARRQGWLSGWVWLVYERGALLGIGSTRDEALKDSREARRFNRREARYAEADRG